MPLPGVRVAWADSTARPWGGACLAHWGHTGHVAGVESQERAVVSEVRKIRQPEQAGPCWPLQDFGCDSEGSREGAQSTRWTRSDSFWENCLACVGNRSQKKSVFKTK